MVQISLLSFFIFLFTACGSGEHEPREEKTLYLKAPIINGVDYRCGERKGVSKRYRVDGITKHGVIKCVYAPLYLSIGSLDLGMVDDFTDGEEIYPENLVPSFDGDYNNEKLLKLALFLQSFGEKNGYIHISDETKNKIMIKSLDDLTVEELKQGIIDIGMVPVTTEDAKRYLLLHSQNKSASKPIIKPFEEDISISLNVGSTIGKLSIDKGDGTLIPPFILSGKNRDNFLLNSNGNLRLIKNLEHPSVCNLTVTASNEFGSSTEDITICIKDSGKIGKAQMGRLSHATVKIFKLNTNGSRELISTDVTKSVGGLNQIGNFELKTELLEDQALYLYEVSGGSDIDIDDNGIADKNATKNRGKLRLLTKGIWVKNAMHKVRVTPLSEMLYAYVERYSYSELEEKLDFYSKILLDKSLDGDSDIDARDIMIFDPLHDKDALYPTLKYNDTYKKIVDKIRAGDKHYKNMLFSAYIVDSFNSNAIEIVGSYIYTVDMLKSGEFAIYDLESKKKIANLKLPDAPCDEDTHVIYIDLLGNEVKISSLSDWSYDIDITNQTKPLLKKEPFVLYAIMSGNFSRIAIGQSYRQNLFSQDRTTYFYDTSLNEGETKIIKIFHLNKDNEIFQYEFDSKLVTIDSLWSYQNYLFVVGDKKIHIFSKKSNKMRLYTIYNKKEIQGNILGIEENILYILDNKKLTLIDISSIENPKWIEEIAVPFNYKLGIKTNGKYITTGSQIVDIATLRVFGKR